MSNAPVADNVAPARCTECCTPCSDDDISPDLMALIEVWPKLPVHIQKAILALGQLSPEGGQ